MLLYSNVLGPDLILLPLTCPLRLVTDMHHNQQWRVEGWAANGTSVEGDQLVEIERWRDGSNSGGVPDGSGGY